jgi:hypothetical protein
MLNISNGLNGLAIVAGLVECVECAECVECGGCAGWAQVLHIEKEFPELVSAIHSRQVGLF